MISIYPAEEQEKHHILLHLKRWVRSGIVPPAQKQNLEDQLALSFQTANFWYRVLFFILTSIALGGITSLFFLIVESFTSEDKIQGVFFFLTGLAFLIVGDILIRVHRMYRKGIEEAFILSGIFNLLWAVPMMIGVRDFEKTACAVGTLVCLGGFLRYGRRYLFVLISLFFAGFIFCFANGHSKPSLFYALSMGQFLFLMIAILQLEKVSHQFLKARWATLAFVQAVLFFAWTYIFGYLDLGYFLKDGLLGTRVAFYRMGWIIPVVYLTYGIFKKQKWALDAGVITLVFTLFTAKKYWNIPTTAWDSLSLGLTLMAIGGALMFAFSRRRNIKGFVGYSLFKQSDNMPEWGALAAATLAPVVSVASPEAQPEGGGGRFGGGGASQGY